MARLAAVDTSVMLELSRKSRSDSRTLKVITVLTLLYLPASFVSVSRRTPFFLLHNFADASIQTLLGMNYVHIAKSRPVLLHFDREFLIFVVLTICLLCITIGVWLWFELRARRLERTESIHGAALQEKQSQDV